ncbi:MAG TPA: hypothetical protein VEX39_15750 [Thermoleophilaceae bacterium]|nr:hypothetical protein [Thermoleophilaceae bacterium]
MAGENRKECVECGVHTFRSVCGNCGSQQLRMVPVRPASRRFDRITARRLAGAMGGRGLRSPGAV